MYLQLYLLVIIDTDLRGTRSQLYMQGLSLIVFFYTDELYSFGGVPDVIILELHFLFLVFFYSFVTALKQFPFVVLFVFIS